MKIKISDNGRNRFTLNIPTWLMMNYFSATFVPLFANREMKKHGAKLTVSMCWKFVHAFNKTKRYFGGKLDLVDVKASDGTFVKITL